nr:sigma-70 family RNA polymerase sigma factor [Sedimentibacter sp.]
MDTDINYIILESIKGDKKSQEILLNKLHPLIYKNIYQYYESDDENIDDLVQEGYLVILNSLRTFDEGQDVHFLGYVKTKIVYFYKNYYRNNKNQRNTISLNQEIKNYNNGTELQDIILNKETDIFDRIIKEDEIRELLSNIKKLSKKEQDILNMYYRDKLSITDISNQLCMAYSTVVCRKSVAVKKLRELMCKN